MVFIGVSQKGSACYFAIICAVRETSKVLQSFKHLFLQVLHLFGFPCLFLDGCSIGYLEAYDWTKRGPMANWTYLRNFQDSESALLMRGHDAILYLMISILPFTLIEMHTNLISNTRGGLYTG